MPQVIGRQEKTASLLDSRFECHDNDRLNYNNGHELRSSIFGARRDTMSEPKTQHGMDRRSFLRSTAAVGAGLAFSPRMFAAASGGGSDINVALLGAGAEGQILMEACRKIPNVKFKAVCDIWEAYNQKRVSQPAGPLRAQVQHLRRLQRDARQGEGQDRRGASSRRPTSGTPSTPSPAWKPGCTSTARRRCPTIWPRPGRWSSARRRRASSSRSAISAAATRGTSTATTS